MRFRLLPEGSVRDWLELSDLELAQRTDYEEKNGPAGDAAMARFSAIRAHLSRVAWNAYAAALDCDRGLNVL
jgi:hypothetical protein